MKTFPSLASARNALRALGLKHNPECRSDHEGWWFGDGTDALVDHSATITHISGVYYVAGYGSVRDKL